MVVLLGLSSSAFYLGKGWEERIAPIKSEVSRLNNDKARLSAEISQLESGGVAPSSAAKPLSETFVSTVTEIARLAEAHSVELSMPVLTTQAGSQAPTNTEVEQMADSVGGSTLKTLRINYKGEYAYYEDFKKFLDTVQNDRRVLSYLKVDNKTVEFSLLVFGN